jgi:hypothetical protein
MLYGDRFNTKEVIFMFIEVVRVRGALAWTTIMLRICRDIASIQCNYSAKTSLSQQCYEVTVPYATVQLSCMKQIE